MPGLTRGSARSTVNWEHAKRSIFCADAMCAMSAPAVRVCQYMVILEVVASSMLPSRMAYR